jgi:hypothetical protein
MRRAFSPVFCLLVGFGPGKETAGRRLILQTRYKKYCIGMVVFAERPVKVLQRRTAPMTEYQRRDLMCFLLLILISLVGWSINRGA